MGKRFRQVKICSDNSSESMAAGMGGENQNHTDKPGAGGASGMSRHWDYTPCCVLKSTHSGLVGVLRQQTWAGQTSTQVFGTSYGGQRTVG